MRRVTLTRMLPGMPSPCRLPARRARLLPCAPPGDHLRILPGPALFVLPPVFRGLGRKVVTTPPRRPTLAASLCRLHTKMFHVKHLFPHRTRAGTQASRVERLNGGAESPASYPRKDASVASLPISGLFR